MRKILLARPFARSAIVVALVGILLIIATSYSASAQVGPFGGLRPPAVGGVGGWIIAKQAIFYRGLAGMIRSAKGDGSAWGLLGISFIYGIFHAAGPGHGKGSDFLLTCSPMRKPGAVALCCLSLRLSCNRSRPSPSSESLRLC